MSNQLTLNTWLLQSERSIHMRCPAGLNVSQDEYLAILQKTSKELELPLKLETTDVYWTDAKLQQKRIVAELTSKERYGILTGLDYVGRIAFVEQRTYLDPFDPPKLENPNYAAAAVIGIGGVVLGVVMFMVGDAAVCLGVIFILLGIILGIVLANSASKAPQQKFDAALDKWIKDVGDLAQRAEVSDELNRMALALDEAVKLAIDKLFTQQGAEMEADDRKRRTAAEIQTELERRKAEGFS